MNSRDDAMELLRRLGAPARLLQHVALVGEALDELLVGLSAMDVGLDVDVARIGVVLHDAGKILHPRELAGPGNDHESAGETLLLQHGVAPDLARICRSHSRWREMDDVVLEELIVALADKLRKGKRDEDLEARVVTVLTPQLSRDRWDVYIEADNLFEDVASRGVERLARSTAAADR